MKKLLLVGGLALGLSMGAVAQKFESKVMAESHLSVNEEVVASIKNDAPKQFAPQYVSGQVDAKSGVSIVNLPTSAFGWRVRLNAIPRLFVDPASEAIVTLNVGDQVDYEIGSDFYSCSSNGLDWAINLRYANADEYEMPNVWYPAFGIFNPNNSDNPEDAYLSFIVNNRNGDNGSYGSLTAGTIGYGESPEGIDHQEEVWEIDEEYKSGPILDVCNVDGNKVFTVCANVDEGGAGFLNSVILIKGEYDETAGKVVYTRNLVEFPEGLFSTPLGPKIAFDPTGTYGYMYCEANLSDQVLESAPHSWPTHIMKTTDGGETWSDIETFYHNEEGFECLQNRLSETEWDVMLGELGWDTPYPGEDAFLYANHWDTDGFVDNEGNLHLALGLRAIYPYEDGWGNIYIDKSYTLVHLFTEPTEDGSIKVDTEIVSDMECYAVTLPETEREKHTLRPAIVPTPDRKYAMFLWSDSDAVWTGDDQNDDIWNSRPSIYGRGYKIGENGNPGEFMGESEPVGETDNTLTPIKNRKNFTFQTFADEAAWFYIPSDYLLYDEASTEEHPIVKVPLKYFEFEGDYPGSFDEPFMGRYIHGAKFEFKPVGFNEISAELSTIKVDQNIPNPFSGETTINIELADAADLSVEVCDLTGQSIQVINKGRVGAGQHEVVIDGSNMAAGMYFYTVNAGMNKITKKMIVK